MPDLCLTPHQLDNMAAGLCDPRLGCTLCLFYNCWYGLHECKSAHTPRPGRIHCRRCSESPAPKSDVPRL